MVEFNFYGSFIERINFRTGQGGYMYYGPQDFVQPIVLATFGLLSNHGLIQLHSLPEIGMVLVMWSRHSDIMIDIIDSWQWLPV